MKNKKGQSFYKQFKHVSKKTLFESNKATGTLNKQFNHKSNKSYEIPRVDKIKYHNLQEIINKA